MTTTPATGTRAPSRERSARTDKIVYAVTTSIIVAVMVFSIVNFVFNDHFPFPDGPEGAFAHLGFPPYFKYELTIAKVLGVVALVVPRVPRKLKELAYAGFALTLLSAAIAHHAVSDDTKLGVFFVLDPLVFLAILGVSYRSFVKLHRP